MTSQRIEDALQLLRSEYSDLPGLSLTVADVARRLNLDRPTTGVILRALEDSRFLERAPNGRFTRSVHRDRGGES